MLNLNMQFSLSAFIESLIRKLKNLKHIFNFKARVLIAAFLLLFLSFFLFRIFHVSQKDNQSQTEIKSNFSIPTIPTPQITSELKEPVLKDINSISTKDWRNYKNNVLGVSFSYPEEWGEVSTSPEKNITHLDTINKDFLDLNNNEFRYMVKISFSKNYKIDINFINDEYSGDKYPNGYADKMGPANNFTKLKETGNICDYHFSFGPSSEFKGSFYEIYNTCTDKIKTVATIDNVSFSGDKKHYDLGSYQFFFKKLNNGYFNNLLVSNLISARQTEENVVYQNQMFPDSELENISSFKKFVGTIKSFTPTATSTIVPQIDPTDNQDLKTVKRYYSLLVNQKLTEAFTMHQNPKFSFQDFTGWYNQIFGANVYNIKQVSSNTYQFDVDLSEKNKPISKYRVIMEVNNNKLNTISSEQITSQEVKFKDYIAYTRTKSNKNEVVLIKNGQETIIASGDVGWNSDNSRNFYSPEFSPLGNYLIYQTLGWEWSSPTLYNLNNGKIVKIDLSYADIIFTKDEKYLISCTSAGIGSGVSAIIYSTSDFSIKKDFKNEIENIKEFTPINTVCSYLPEKSEYVVTVNDNNNKQRTIEYNLNTNQETIK